MKKILFYAIMVILVSVVCDAQDKQVTQTDPVKQEQQPQQTEPTAQEAAPVAQEKPAQPEETDLGKVYIPKDFVHADKDYKKGIYFISLFDKEGAPWFKVYNNKKELLFEELAVVKPFKGKAKQSKPRVRKEFLKDFEYFRIMVIKPENRILAYFLVKQKEVPAPVAPAAAAEETEKKEETGNEEEKTTRFPGYWLFILGVGLIMVIKGEPLMFFFSAVFQGFGSPDKSFPKRIKTFFSQ
jgi:hypothetical protein